MSAKFTNAKSYDSVSALVFALVLAFTTAPLGARADSSTGSLDGSSAIGRGSATIVAGSVEVLAAGGEFIVQAIAKTASGTLLVLKRGSDGVRVSVLVAGAAATAAGVLAGQSIHAVSTAGGNILHQSGKVIAFIPNELGKRLVYTAEHTALE